MVKTDLDGIPLSRILLIQLVVVVIFFERWLMIRPAKSWYPDIPHLGCLLLRLELCFPDDLLSMRVILDGCLLVRLCTQLISLEPEVVYAQQHKCAGYGAEKDKRNGVFGLKHCSSGLGLKRRGICYMRRISARHEGHGKRTQGRERLSRKVNKDSAPFE